MLDSQAPHSLIEAQKLFVRLVTQPLAKNHQLNICYAKEAASFIASGPLLSAHKKIELYHQQYWWRLIHCLQSNFPSLVHFLGYQDFEEIIAIPYLSQHPPQHWALSQLGNTLPMWVKKNSSRKDGGILFTLTSIDWACQEAFSAKEGPLTHLENESASIYALFYLQPHIHLFHLDRNVFTFREQLVQKEVGFWQTAPLPSLEYGVFYYVVYRTPKLQIACKQLSYYEYFILNFFKEGATVQSLCSEIESLEEWEQFPEEDLFFFFREWMLNKWFTTTKYRNEIT